MTSRNNNGFTKALNVTISEKQLSRYFELSETAKELEKEMKEIKQVINTFFDKTIGKDQKGEVVIGNFRLQRQIRLTENYDEEKTVIRLEEKQLNDCIQTIRIPSKEKIEAAITLGLLDESDIEDCVVRKVTKAISVRKK